MKVVIWHGCRVDKAFDCDGPGPDIHIDPWADLIGTVQHRSNGDRIDQMPVPYHTGGIGLHVLPGDNPDPLVDKRRKWHFPHLHHSPRSA